MTRDEVLAFVKANPVAFMATVERGKPRVRAMQTALIEPAGLVFCTGVQKDVHQQLVACGSVELAYWNAKRARGSGLALQHSSLLRSLAFNGERDGRLAARFLTVGRRAAPPASGRIAPPPCSGTWLRGGEGVLADQKGSW